MVKEKEKTRQIYETEFTGDHKADILFMIGCLFLIVSIIGAFIFFVVN